jgi:uncharacterized repeat protein (TIGR04138 family)
MHEATFEEGLDQILAKDPRYHRDAYLFVREALEHTQKAIHKEEISAPTRPVAGQESHVTGQQLLEGIRAYALVEFGPMAITVLEEWGVRNCRDFGEIVFNMVETSCLKKTEQDSRADFEGGYGFEEAFRKPFLPKSKLARETKPVA